ncbi:MAG: FAD-dependent oxidoreductase [Pseudomonadota bacterium]
MNDLPTHIETLIVGGGIVGCSTAYHLAREGVETLLLERQSLTCGTTWHAAGLMGQLRATANMTKLARYSLELYHELESRYDAATGLRETGSLALALNDARMEEILRQASMANQYGIACEELSPEDVSKRWPLLNTQDLVGALHILQDGQTNPVDTTRALATAARSHGALIREGVAALELLHDGQRVTGVETSEGTTITADKVILCAGLWSRALAQKSGVALPLYAAEHFYAVTEPVSDLPNPLPTIREPDNGFYMKGDAGRILIGAFELKSKPLPLEKLPADFSFDELPFDFDHFEPFLSAAVQRMPILEDTGIRTWFNGPESFTPDDRYLMGETPELKDLFVATGFNSVGIQSAGGAGKVVADWVINGRPPMDLWDVDVRRTASFQATENYLYERTGETLGLLYAMHWPFRQYDTARHVRHSPLHERLRAQNACFGELAGWERANWYAPSGVEPIYEYSYGRQNWFDYAAEEHQAARENVSLFDQSSFSKYLLQGRDACHVLNWLCTADMDVPTGRVVYTQWLNENGGIEADVTITRTASDTYLIVTAAGSQRRDFNWLQRHLPEDAHVFATDVTSGYAVLGLMGPKSRDLLSQLTPSDLSNEAFPFGTSQEIEIGPAIVRAIRITYVGELGFELYMPTEFALAVYDNIISAGKAFNLRHAGYHAMDSLRIEKAYRHWGHDITDEDTPLEAGLGFTIAWDKAGGFIGREALLQQKEVGLKKRLAIFALEDSEAMLYHNEPIWRDGKRVGHITSAAYGHALGCSVGLGYVESETPIDRAFVRSGNYEIEIAGRLVPAKVSLKPLYDPKNLAIRC